EGKHYESSRRLMARSPSTKKQWEKLHGNAARPQSPRRARDREDNKRPARARAQIALGRNGRRGRTAPEFVAARRDAGARQGRRDAVRNRLAHLRTVIRGRGSGAFHLKLHIDVAARGVRVRAYFLVCLLGERGEFGLRQSRIFDAQLYCQSEAASLAWSDRYVGGNARPAGILFMLLADEIERSAETGGVAGGEKMFGRCRAGLAGTA